MSRQLQLECLIIFTIIHTHFKDALDFYGSQAGELKVGVIGIIPIFQPLMAALSNRIL